MINNVVLVSGVQQSDSVIYIHGSVLFQILWTRILNHNILSEQVGVGSMERERERDRKRKREGQKVKEEK